MKKIMFYCQYLTGMGHLVRSTEIARALAKHFRVYFINPEELEPTDLARRILASLNKPPVANTAQLFDLQGAQKTTAFLQELLQSNVSNASNAA